MKYIINKKYDLFFLVFSPIFALVALFGFELFLSDESIYYIYISLTQGHLLVTSIRAYGNKDVYKDNKLKFFLFPTLLFVLIFLSKFLFIFFYIIMIYWDIFHSSLQNYGIGKIYDNINKQDVFKIIKLDKILNLFLYAFPTMIGSSIFYYIKSFEKIEDISIKSFFQYSLPDYIKSNYNIGLIILLSLFTLFIIYYIIKIKSIKKYKMPKEKIFLSISVGVSSFFAAFFLEPAKAFFVINFFHALQYFTLIYFKEKNNIKLFKYFSDFQNLIILIIIFSLFGFLMVTNNSSYAEIFLIVCAMNHFWLDGIIWKSNIISHNSKK